MKRVKQTVFVMGGFLFMSGCQNNDELTIQNERNKQIEVIYGEEFDFSPESLGIQAKEMDLITYNKLDLSSLGKQRIVYEYKNQTLEIEVEVVDKKAPIMQAEKVVISVSDWERLDDMMQLSAIDDYDGDISEQVVCDPVGISELSVPMELQRVCRAADSSGNETEITVDIHVVEEVEQIETYANGIINALSVNPQIVNNPDSITVMVNKFNALPEDYAPSDLVDIGGGHQLRAEAAVQFAAMKEKADNEGIVLNVLSSYRTKSYQEGLFWNYANSEGIEYASVYSAVPRRSEHELGLAIDVGDSYYLDENLDHTATGIWLNENAANYGFIMRYPEDKVLTTQYGFEAWHYRYVGADLALRLKESNLTLEEFYQAENLNDDNSYRFY